MVSQNLNLPLDVKYTRKRSTKLNDSGLKKAKINTKTSESLPNKSRITRIITACKRCRSKKIKCDKQFPKCSNCVKAGDDAECMSVDAGTGEVISRSYIFDLEMKVKSLSDEIEQLRNQKSDSLDSNLNSFNFDKILFMKTNDIQETPTIDEDELPSRVFVESCLELFFLLSNVQLPILNKEYYLIKYYKPLYGKIGKKLWLRVLDKLNDIDNTEEEQYPTVPMIENKHERDKCLFYLNIILAISTSLHQKKYPLSLSNHYKQNSLRYIGSIWQPTEGVQDEMHKLEMLQSLLLLSQYSIMRPCTPGAWYLIGTSVRLCLDLGLHYESWCDDNRMNSSQSASFINEMKRRLFWSCYSLDRQISMNFGRPFAIDEKQIDVRLPSLLDDSVILPDNMKKEILIYGDSFKSISLHFIKLRILQSEIFDFINDKSNRIEMTTKNKDGDVIDDPTSKSNEIDLKLESFNNWKKLKHNRLSQWYDNPPKINNNLDFYRIIFDLNFHQTLIHLFGISAITPVITDIAHHQTLYNSGNEIITAYSNLHNDLKLMNYSWVAINNLFLGGSCYLYSIYNCSNIRSKVDTADIKFQIDILLRILDELSFVCYDQAKNCQSKIQLLSSLVIELCESEKNLKRDSDLGTNASKNLNPSFLVHQLRGPASNSFAHNQYAFNNSHHVYQPVTEQLPLKLPTPSTYIFENTELISLTPDNSIFFSIDNSTLLNNMVGSINATSQDSPANLIHHNVNQPQLNSEFENYTEALDPEIH